MGSLTNLISIVDADADLASLLDGQERERARREALTRVRNLSVGEWDAAGAIEEEIHHRGFLIIEGLLSREVDVLGRQCVEQLRIAGGFFHHSLIGFAKGLKQGLGVRRWRVLKKRSHGFHGQFGGVFASLSAPHAVGYDVSAGRGDQIEIFVILADTARIG